MVVSGDKLFCIIWPDGLLKKLNSAILSKGCNENIGAPYFLFWIISYYTKKLHIFNFIHCYWTACKNSHSGPSNDYSGIVELVPDEEIVNTTHWSDIVSPNCNSSLPFHHQS